LKLGRRAFATSVLAVAQAIALGPLAAAQARTPTLLVLVASDGEITASGAVVDLVELAALARGVVSRGGSRAVVVVDRGVGSERLREIGRTLRAAGITHVTRSTDSFGAP
jgi:hypothetical protein